MCCWIYNIIDSWITNLQEELSSFMVNHWSLFHQMNLVATMMHIVKTAGQGGRHCQPVDFGKVVFKAVNKMRHLLFSLKWRLQCCLPWQSGKQQHCWRAHSHSLSPHSILHYQSIPSYSRNLRSWKDVDHETYLQTSLCKTDLLPWQFLCLCEVCRVYNF